MKVEDWEWRFGSRVSSQGRLGRIFHFWLSHPKSKGNLGAGKVSFDDNLCHRCKYRLKPSSCVAQILSLRKKGKGDLLYATWPTSLSTRNCTINRKANIRPVPYTSDWSKVLYPPPKVAVPLAVDKKKREAQKKVYAELRPYVLFNDRAEDGTVGLKWMDDKDLFMKGLRAGLLKKNETTGRWRLIPLEEEKGGKKSL